MANHTVEAVDVPSLLGLTIQEAANVLTGVGVGVALLPGFPDPQPGATVTGSIPAEGQLAIVGSTVTLFWADPPGPPEAPPPPPTVPVVIGFDEQSAVQAIEAAGYYAAVNKFYDLKTDAGKVFMVNPPGGTLLDPGFWVTITVSLGTGPIRRWVPPPVKKTLPPFPIE